MTTLATAEAHLAAWEAASLAVASNQSYSITVEGNTRQLTRANATEIKNMIVFWQGQVAQLGRSASRRSRSRYIAN